MKTKTLSQIRREAGLKGGATRRAKALRDPLTTISIRKSSHQALRNLADAKGATMTDTLHTIIQAQVDHQVERQVERK
jgi:hypothetical protein